MEINRGYFLTTLWYVKNVKKIVIVFFCYSIIARINQEGY